MEKKLKELLTSPPPNKEKQTRLIRIEKQWEINETSHNRVKS
jgi:hypothetical protein